MKITAFAAAAALCALTLSACVAEPAEESRADSAAPTTAVTSVTTTPTTTAVVYPTVGYCVADPSMYVRSQPAPYAEVIGGLAYGEEVSIVGKEGDWYKIAFKDDFAYVSAQYILGELPAPTADPAATAGTTAETSAAPTETAAVD